MALAGRGVASQWWGLQLQHSQVCSQLCRACVTVATAVDIVTVRHPPAWWLVQASSRLKQAVAAACGCAVVWLNVGTLCNVLVHPALHRGSTVQNTQCTPDSSLASGVCSARSRRIIQG